MHLNNEIIESVKRAAKHFGVEAYTDQLINTIRPVAFFYKHLQEQVDMPIGTSRFGGDPDLPADFDWPTTFDDRFAMFALQIDLAELVPMELDLGLPPDGLMSFFTDDEDGRPDTKVVIHGRDQTLVRRPVPDKIRETFVQYPDHYANRSSHRIEWVRSLQMPATIPLSFGPVHGPNGPGSKLYDLIEAWNDQEYSEFDGHVGSYPRSIASDSTWAIFVDKMAEEGLTIKNQNAIHHNLNEEQRAGLFDLYDSIRFLGEFDWADGDVGFYLMDDDLKAHRWEETLVFYNCS